MSLSPHVVQLKLEEPANNTRTSTQARASAEVRIRKMAETIPQLFDGISKELACLFQLFYS
jgi:hypothetical protein